MHYFVVVAGGVEKALWVHALMRNQHYKLTRLGSVYAVDIKVGKQQYYIACGGEDKTASVYSFTNEPDEEVLHLCDFKQSDKGILTVSLRIFDQASGENGEHKECVWLAAAGMDKVVRVYNVLTRSLLCQACHSNLTKFTSSLAS